MHFPDKWKMSNVCPIHKKDAKNRKENYRPISLLPILSKIFDKVIFDSHYDYFIHNDLLTPCQSGFIKGDSCVNQLLAITHEIHKNLDANPSIDTVGIFLDMSLLIKFGIIDLFVNCNHTESIPIYYYF